jgi:hypothetical protein
MKVPRSGLSFLLSSAAMAGLAALSAGDSCLFASPLVSRTFGMGCTAALPGDFSLLFGIH